MFLQGATNKLGWKNIQSISLKKYVGVNRQQLKFMLSSLGTIWAMVYHRQGLMVRSRETQERTPKKELYYSRVQTSGCRFKAGVKGIVVNRHDQLKLRTSCSQGNKHISFPLGFTFSQCRNVTRIKCMLWHFECFFKRSSVTCSVACSVSWSVTCILCLFW